MRDIRLIILRWLGVIAVAAFAISVFTPIWNVAGSMLAVEPDLQKADAVVANISSKDTNPGAYY